jgi:hypothetical protein
MAWPHVEQNAVVGEISLPHFEQYTKSPFVATAKQARLEQILLVPSAVVNLECRQPFRSIYSQPAQVRSPEVLYDFQRALVQLRGRVLQLRMLAVKSGGVLVGFCEGEQLRLAI